MGRIMAVDYGGKRCGIAVTDPQRIIASGLDTVHPNELIPFIQEYAKREPLDLLVVGLPYRMDGSLSPIAEQIKGFLDKLSKAIPELAIDGIDESYSSQQAVQALIQSGVPKKKRRQKELVDKVSATLILQRYMEEKQI